MGKGPFRGSKLDCRFDHVVAAAIQQGYGKVLVYSGLESYERADDIRKGVYRCTRHRGVTGDAGPSRLLPPGAGPDEMGIRKTGKTYELRFRVWDKRTGRKRHLERHGTDRASWPYDPRRRATEDERAQWANRDERGHPVIH